MACVHKPVVRNREGIGNSQILPYDYHLQADIELVFPEMAERGNYSLATEKDPAGLTFMPPTQKIEGLPSIHCQQVGHNPPRFYPVMLFCDSFAPEYEGGAIRQKWCFYGELVEECLFNSFLFDDPVALEKEKLQQTIDTFRDQFGFTSLQKALTTRKLTLLRNIKLTGGHSAGGLDLGMIDRSYLPYQSRPAEFPRSWHG